MLYSAETWTLGRYQTNKLLAIEMNFGGRQRRNTEIRIEYIRIMIIGKMTNVKHRFIEITERSRLK